MYKQTGLELLSINDNRSKIKKNIKNEKNQIFIGIIT